VVQPATAIEPPPAPVASTPPPPGSVLGRLDGPARDLVASIAAFGPDNILREAARAVPAPDGTWRIDGLPPGGYRIVADGTAGRVLICQPPYITVKVEPGAGSEAQVLSVLREAHRAPGPP